MLARAGVQDVSRDPAENGGERMAAELAGAPQVLVHNRGNGTRCVRRMHPVRFAKEWKLAMRGLRTRQCRFVPADRERRARRATRRRDRAVEIRAAPLALRPRRHGADTGPRQPPPDPSRVPAIPPWAALERSLH